MPQFLKIKTQRPRFLRVGRAKQFAPAVIRGAYDELLGKAVFFGSGGERVAGKVARVQGDSLVIQLAVPSSEGLLLVTDSELTVKASDVEVTKALMQHKRVRSFESGVEIAAVSQGDAKFAIVTDSKDGPPTDYLNLSIEGHASTFGTPTDRDRGGDYVLPGAFNKTLLKFKQNPVLLINHDNCVECIAGSWTKIGVDQTGLAVRGTISNAPGIRDTRFKLVEGHLKGLSIGGIWHYGDDGYAIEEAELFEISLVAVPMNPKTLAHTASLGEADCRKAFSRFWRDHSSLRSE